MKRFILVVMLCMALIVCFVSCSNKTNDAQQNENISTEDPSTEDPTTEPIITQEQLPRELLKEDPKDKEIIIALWSYLDRLHASINMGDGRAERKIDGIKNGSKQALYVSFDSNCYYVCGYYNAAHDYAENYNNDYCCVSNYTWVKFSDNEKITERYNDMSFVVAFQINKARVVKDIVTNESGVPEFEHYYMYSPEFVDGINIANVLACDVSFLYCKSVSFENNYYLIDSVDSRVHWLNTFPCFELNGEIYVAQEINKNDLIKNLESEFGKYYDILMKLMLPNKYSEIKNGITYYYGLFDIDEFANKVLK